MLARGAACALVLSLLVSMASAGPVDPPSESCHGGETWTSEETPGPGRTTRTDVYYASHACTPAIFVVHKDEVAEVPVGVLVQHGRANSSEHRVEERQTDHDGGLSQNTVYDDRSSGSTDGTMAFATVYEGVEFGAGQFCESRSFHRNTTSWMTWQGDELHRSEQSYSTRESHCQVVVKAGLAHVFVSDRCNAWSSTTNGAGSGQETCFRGVEVLGPSGSQTAGEHRYCRTEGGTQTCGESTEIAGRPVPLSLP